MSAAQKLKARQAQAGKASGPASAAAAASAAATAPSAAAAAAPSASSSSRRSGPAARSRWAVDLPDGRAAPSTFLASGSSSSDVVPFGFASSAASGGDLYRSGGADDDRTSAKDEAKQADLVYASAMSIAQAPGKQLLMTAFMLWMSGNSLQIFSIMMLGMALWTPVQEIINVHTRFARFSESNVNLTLPKLTFVAIHMAGLALGLYKCNTMGLLPTSTADWIDASMRAPVQVAGGGMI